MPEHAVTFRCGSDELVGILHAGQRPPGNLGVLFVVGGPQYRVGSHRQFVLMARSFAAAGYPVFRFDYRGMGDSTGALRTFESVDDDIRAAMDEFHQQVPQLRGVVVFGLCDAASAALMYCVRDQRLKGLILANPWVRTQAGEAKAYVRHYYGQRLLQASFWKKLATGKLRVLESARGFVTSWRKSRGRLGASRVETGATFIERMRLGLLGGRMPVLVLISERDLTASEFVDLCQGSPVWSQAIAGPLVRMATLPDADHTFSSRGALDRAMETCLKWLAELRS